MKKNNIFIGFIISLILCIVIPFTASADDYYIVDIFDMANVLTESEEANLIETAEHYKDYLKMDIVFVTTTDTNGKDSMNYADDFYDGLEGEHKYAKDGILFLLDLDNESIYISTAGRAIKLMSDREIDEALDIFMEYRHASYGTAMYEMANWSFQNMSLWLSEGADSTWYYIKPTARQIIYGFLITIFIVGTMIFAERRKGHPTVSATEYVDKNGYNIKDKRVNFIRNYSTTHKGYYKKSNSSSSGHSSGSSHRSSSGRSHGGGGRRL